MELDLLASRYGKLPSELKEMSLEDLQFNYLIMSVGLKSEKDLLKKRPGRSRLSTGR